MDLVFSTCRRNWKPSPLFLEESSMSPGMSARVMLLSSMKRSLPAEAERTQVRRERGEGVGGDLGLAPGERGQERGLACIRHADKADIRDDLQLEQHELLVSFGARQPLLDHVVVHVALAAAAPAHDSHLVVLVGQVRDELSLVVVERCFVLRVYRGGSQLLRGLFDQLVHHRAHRD